jgi:L,D-peptidoglycan transpeptidase YkuD (ErfK/YbiS/YcfS/YnhG family)
VALHESLPAPCASPAPTTPTGAHRTGAEPATSASGAPTSGAAAGFSVAPRPTPAPRPAPRPPLLVEQMADTRGARQVVTVTTSPGRAAPVLDAFELVAGRWWRTSGPVPAVIGARGFSTRVSEGSTATPIGLFTLTEAFGTSPDPGTALPYRHSRYGDVWVDDPAASTYNTRQTGDADFSKGAGERLWQLTRAYEYAVVIDYNRRPVRAGAGSAFFLHVTIPAPSQGCVTVRRDRLVWLLRWLNPAARPVIALGPAATVRTM